VKPVLKIGTEILLLSRESLIIRVKSTIF
jgi:hypothetical protein